jgi:hypothetical protein
MKAGIVLTVSIAMLVRRLLISVLVARADFVIVKAVKRQLILKHAVAVVRWKATARMKATWQFQWAVDATVPVLS